MNLFCTTSLGMIGSLQFPGRGVAKLWEFESKLVKMTLISTNWYDFYKFALFIHDNMSPMLAAAVHDLLIIRLRIDILTIF